VSARLFVLKSSSPVWTKREPATWKFRLSSSLLVVIRFQLQSKSALGFLLHFFRQPAETWALLWSPFSSRCPLMIDTSPPFLAFLNVRLQHINACSGLLHLRGQVRFFQPPFSPGRRARFSVFCFFGIWCRTFYVSRPTEIFTLYGRVLLRLNSYGAFRSVRDWSPHSTNPPTLLLSARYFFVHNSSAR